jgi:hypothetical protein
MLFPFYAYVSINMYVTLLLWAFSVIASAYIAFLRVCVLLSVVKFV